MKFSKYSFEVDATIEHVEEELLPADRWPSFVPGYRGLEEADSNWPEKGSSLTFRYGFGPWTSRIKTTVVEYEPGRHFHTYEESDWFTDDVDFIFDEEDSKTRLTFVRDTTMKPLAGRILQYIYVGLGGRGVFMGQVKKRIKAMVENYEE